MFLSLVEFNLIFAFVSLSFYKVRKMFRLTTCIYKYRTIYRTFTHMRNLEGKSEQIFKSHYTRYLFLLLYK